MVVFSGGGTEGLTDLEFYGAHVPNAAAKSEKIEQGDGLRDALLGVLVQRGARTEEEMMPKFRFAGYLRGMLSWRLLRRF